MADGPGAGRARSQAIGCCRDCERSRINRGMDFGAFCWDSSSYQPVMNPRAGLIQK